MKIISWHAVAHCRRFVAVPRFPAESHGNVLATCCLTLSIILQRLPYTIFTWEMSTRSFGDALAFKDPPPGREG